MSNLLLEFEGEGSHRLPLKRQLALAGMGFLASGSTVVGPRLIVFLAVLKGGSVGYRYKKLESLGPGLTLCLVFFYSFGFLSGKIKHGPIFGREPQAPKSQPQPRTCRNSDTRGAGG